MDGMSQPARVSVAEFMALLARIPVTEEAVAEEEARQEREEFRDMSHYWMTLKSVTSRNTVTDSHECDTCKWSDY